MALFTYLLALLVVRTTTALPVQHDFSRTRGGLQADAKQGTPEVHGDTSSFEMIGACRANCVEQTLPMEYPPTFDGCGRDESCSTCWHLCKNLFNDEMIYRPVCDDCAGSVGCTSACKYSFSSVSTPDTLSWEFEQTPVTTEVSEEALHVSWDTPRPRPLTKGTPPPTGRPFLVYTMLFRDNSNPHWSLVIQTLDHITEVTGPHTKFPGLQFLLLVSSPSGTVARDYPPYPAVPNTVSTLPTTTTTSTTSTTQAMPTPRPRQTAEKRLPINPNQDPASMSGLSVDVRVVDGRLEAVLTWNQEIHVAPSHVMLRYTVQWERRSCNVDRRMPHCPLSEENMVEGSIPAEDKQEMSLILSRLTFNSEYWLELGFESFGEPVKTAFFTPGCPKVDPTFSFCLPPRSPTTEPTTTTTPRTTRSTTPTSTTNKAVPTFGTFTMPPKPSVEEVMKSLETWNALYSSSSSKSNKLTVRLVLISVSASLGCLVLLTLAYLIYRHRCQRPQPQIDIAQLLQSYSELPLLGISRPGSMASLHHLQCRNPLAQSILLNGSSYYSASPHHLLTPPTPTRPGLTPPTSPHHHHPLMTAPASGLQGPSHMDGHHLSSSAQPVAWSTPFDQEQPHQPSTTQLRSTSPRGTRNTRSKSMDGLNEGPSTQLGVHVQSMATRSISTSQLPAARSPRRARRSIDFDQIPQIQVEAEAEETERMLSEDEQECEHVWSFHASIPPINQYLHTVPDDADLMMGESDVEMEETTSPGSGWIHHQLIVHKKWGESEA